MVGGEKFAIMKFIIRHKVFFGCLLVLWLIGMLLTVMIMGKGSNPKLSYRKPLHPLLHPLQLNRLPASSSMKMVKALRYCNPPDDIVIGDEGRSPDNHSLHFVAIVIRHGDRAPLRPIRNQSVIDCGVNERYYLLRQYLITMKSIQRKLKQRHPFSGFPLYPNEKRCSSGQMTLIGSQQHLQLGSVLKRVYSYRYELLTKDWQADQFKVYSTVYPRTYQSALAFLFGFLPEFDFEKIKIFPSAHTTFCLSLKYCQCPLLENLQWALDRKMRRLIDLHPAVVRLVDRLNPVVKLHPNHSDIESPLVMFDSLMGYVCHESHLPCVPRTHNCVTFDHVRNIIAFLDWQGSQFIEDNSHKKHSTLRMQGLLSDLLQHMENRIHGRSNQRFVLYSGHDITLAPLITALGFDDGKTPPYAARLVFEVFNNNDPNSKSKFYLKIIYNGKDVTRYVPFCKPFFRNFKLKSSILDVCPFESFSNFVRNDFYERVNATSYEAACSLSQAVLNDYKTNYSLFKGSFN